MPNDFDWIFKRDPFCREQPKEEALAVRRSHPTDARDAYEPETIDRFATLVAGTHTAETAGVQRRTRRRGSDSSRDDQGASTANEP